MIADVPGAKDQSTVLFRSQLGHFFGHVGVFDDAGPFSPGGQHSHFFVGTGLPQGLVAAIRLLANAVSDEGGIGRFDEGVVDSKDVDVSDALGFHVGENGVFDHGGVDAAVAVGCHGERGGGFEDQFAVVGHGGEGALREEGDVESEVVVLSEVRRGLFVVEGGGHDVEGDGPVALAGQGAELLEALGDEAEERPPRGEADVVHPLGPVVAEAGALSAGQQEGGDFSGLDGVQADLMGPFQQLGRGGVGGGGGGAGALEGLDFVFGGHVGGVHGLELFFLGEGAGEEGGELFEGDFVDGAEEGVLGGRGDGGVRQVGQDVGLAGGVAAGRHGGEEGVVVVGHGVVLCDVCCVLNLTVK
mmetsp:Transcript_9076/g.19375  ORF Transcript_9076/g.19375 Transcript_9076/m.19375 type:complete len:358 (-) Transcript_9076:144-1217(-)